MRPAKVKVEPRKHGPNPTPPVAGETPPAQPVAAGRPGRPAVRPGALPSLLLVAALVVSGAVAAGLSLGEQVLGQVERIWGRNARDRIVAWQTLLAAERGAPEARQLAVVNAFFNRLPNVDDATQWGADDYWATPLELLAANGGDCEDFAIAKYFTLRDLGVPESRLRITYVKLMLREEQRIEAHMVLAYYPSADAEPLILDNRAPEIRAASARSDLLPTYGFNGEGLWLAKERGRGRRVEGGTRLTAWQNLQERMKNEPVPERRVSPGAKA